MKNYQVMPELTEEEYEELKNDIAERGVMVPVEIDEYGNILDGYNRVKICEELNITDFPTICREGLTEEEKFTHARKLNLARRHLSQEQKRELIREQIKETPELSDRQMARDLGISHPTVGTVRREMEDAGEVVKFTTSTGPDGKKYPRERKKKEQGSELDNNEESPTLDAEQDDGFMNEPEEPEPDVNEYAQPREMSATEDLLMALKDEADGEDSVLRMLLDDYEGDDDKKTMLFSEDGISASLEGLSALRKVIEKYEQIIESRK